MLKGGGRAHGPKPRDFSTELPKKLYDLAWRTALSYRYRKGDLLIVETVRSLDMDHKTSTEIAVTTELFREKELEPRLDKDGNVRAKSTLWIIEEDKDHKFEQALATHWPKDKVKTIEELDVKNLLEGGRIVMEKQVLDSILKSHQSDLRPAIDIALARSEAEEDAQKMQEAVSQTLQKVRIATKTESLSKAVESVEEETETMMSQAQRRLNRITKRLARRNESLSAIPAL
jgi:Ribosomal protein L4/L1 family